MVVGGGCRGQTLILLLISCSWSLQELVNIFVVKFFQDCNLHIKDVMASLIEMTSSRFAKISPLNIALVFGKNVNFKNTRS